VPRSPATQGQLFGRRIRLLADASDPSTGNQDYSFDPSTLMLTLGGQPVRLADGVSVGQGPGMFGFDCGPLFASPLATLGDAASQTTTYQWTTGANDWNQLRTVKDSGGRLRAVRPTVVIHLHAPRDRQPL